MFTRGTYQGIGFYQRTVFACGMKRVDLIRHLMSNGCELFREGGSHSVYLNRETQRSSAVPRHREVNDFLAKKICRDLQIPEV